jgi:serine protease Do
MWRFLSIAVGLALASGGVTAAALQRPEGGPAPQERAQTIVVEPGDQLIADAFGIDDELMRDDEDPGEPGTIVRRLAIMPGRGVELGVSITDLDAEQLKTTTGAVVEEVREESAAAKAGIQKGDVITEFDGEHVRSARHLSRLVAETAEGRTVKTAVLRAGKRVDLTVTPAAPAHAGREFDVRPDLAPKIERFVRPGERGDFERHFFSDELPMKRFGPREFEFRSAPEFGFGPTAGRGRLGIGIQNLTPQLAEYFGTKDGVLVTTVKPDSPAAKAGLKAGDVITTINGKPVNDAGDLAEVVRRSDDGAKLEIGYTRDKKPATASASVPAVEKPRSPDSLKPI